MRKIVITIISVIIFSNISAQESYVVTASTLNLRQYDAPNAPVLLTLKRGDVVGLIDKTNIQWWKVNYYGNIGYISSKYLLNADESEDYKSYEKLNISTGDNYECENISPKYAKEYDNELRVVMGNITDGVVKLMNDEKVCIRIAYIKAGETFSMRNVPLGKYTLRIAYGKDLRRSMENGNCIVRFIQNPVYKEGYQVLSFEKILDTKRSNQNTGDLYYKLSGYQLELNAIEAFKEQNSKKLTTNKISEKSFNQ